MKTPNVRPITSEFQDSTSREKDMFFRLATVHLKLRTIVFAAALAALTVSGATTQFSSAHGLQPTTAHAMPPYTEVWEELDPLLDGGRSQHVAAALQDGRVLIAGGTLGPSAQIIDPDFETAVSVDPMIEGRSAAEAITLPNGDVLVVGGCPSGRADGLNGCSYNTVEAERFDGATWHNEGQMIQRRNRNFTATEVSDGRVLVVAGVHGYNTYLNSVELWDPVTKWQGREALPPAVPNLHGHSAALLQDGRVMVVGGWIAGPIRMFGGCLLYDVDNNVWSSCPAPSIACASMSLTTLADGRVLAAGGSDFSGNALNLSEIYTPAPNAPGAWEKTGDLNWHRNHPMGVSLDDGTALVAGGCTEGWGNCTAAASELMATAERFDPATDTWWIADALSLQRTNFTLTALSSARALAVGGLYNASQNTDRVERYGEAMIPSECHCLPEIMVLQDQIDDLEARVSSLESLLVHFTRTSDEVFVTGANLHIVDGSTDTDGATNGLGNLIVGYDEGPPADKTGSHMVVVGAQHSYSSFGGIVSGFDNTTSDRFASVLGGRLNTASGRFATVTGGAGNISNGVSSSISGGAQGKAYGLESTVTGGSYNRASGAHSTVSGGIRNTSTLSNATVSGGNDNTADRVAGTVGGGSNTTLAVPGACGGGNSMFCIFRVQRSTSGQSLGVR